MPDAPEVHDQDDAVQIAQGEQQARRREEHRRQAESPSKALEQRAIAVRAQHPGQMMSDGAKGGHKQRQLFDSPARLGGEKHRDDEKRSPYKQHQILPRGENP